MRASNHEVVRGVEPRDEAVFPALVDRYGPSLYRVAFSLIGSAADAEDIVQETFLAAFEGWNRFEGRSSVKTWLTGILVKKAARHRRYRKLRNTLSLDHLSGVLRSAFGHTQTTVPLSKHEMRMDIETLFGTLSPEHREAMALREVQGMSYKEMAAVLGVPVGTVESRLHRARQVLRDRFSDYFA